MHLPDHIRMRGIPFFRQFPRLQARRLQDRTAAPVKEGKSAAYPFHHIHLFIP